MKDFLLQGLVAVLFLAYAALVLATFLGVVQGVGAFAQDGFWPLGVVFGVVSVVFGVASFSSVPSAVEEL